MTCKLKRFEMGLAGLEEKIYRCDQVRELHYEWKKKYREKNRTDEVIAKIGKDDSYVRYCKDIDDFLLKCECPIENESKISKNIREAKERRLKGECLWEKKTDN